MSLLILRGEHRVVNRAAIRNWSNRTAGQTDQDCAYRSAVYSLNPGERLMTALRTVLTSLFVVFGIQTSSSAQWLTGARGVPRAADGKIDLSAPAPKTEDGKPDIRGTWQIPPPPQYLQNLAKDLKPGELEMTPWAQ